jgi:hypothetical protein
MVRSDERCFPHCTGHEICQPGLKSVPRPRNSKSVETRTNFVPMLERICESSSCRSEDQVKRIMLGSGKGCKLVMNLVAMRLKKTSVRRAFISECGEGSFGSVRSQDRRFPLRMYDSVTWSECDGSVRLTLLWCTQCSLSILGYLAMCPRLEFTVRQTTISPLCPRKTKKKSNRSRLGPKSGAPCTERSKSLRPLGEAIGSARASL